jgi:hypothetical protein
MNWYFTMEGETVVMRARKRPHERWHLKALIGRRHHRLRT